MKSLKNTRTEQKSLKMLKELLDFSCGKSCLFNKLDQTLGLQCYGLWFGSGGFPFLVVAGEREFLREKQTNYITY